MIETNNLKTASILASFATLKSLSDEKKFKNSYQLLREFIIYVIIKDSIYSFSAVEMKNKLKEHFCFFIPEAVIKTSLKNMSGLSLEKGIYYVSMGKINSESLFEVKKKEADEYNSCIIKYLSDYIASRTNYAIIDEEVLTKELINFLIDDTSFASSKYTDFISEFVLKNEHDKDIQEGLNRIREGSILYMGLSCNIREIGSITKPLILYLGTEILFSLIGYNGEIYQQFANDFYEQVRIANSGDQKKIFLRYFSDIKREIDDFFKTAEEIVEGKKRHLLDKTAMKAIINGCKTSADVEVKKSDFYYKLQYSYGITEDPTDNYYDEKYFLSNLESSECDEDDDKNEKKEIALKLISNINKLRNGNYYYNDIDSEYLIVTNTKITLLISKEQSDLIKKQEELDNISNFAVSLDRITSLLWYKLESGFSKKAFPSSVNAILKARVVLSSSIAKKAEKAFSEVKKQYENGDLSKDQVAARIITLRNKPNFPEDLKGDNIDEIMDFSPEYLSRYEEKLKNTKSTLREKEEFIATLEAVTKKAIFEKDATIASQKDIIKGKDDENAKLLSKVREYERQEAEKISKKEKQKNMLKYIGKILLKILLIFILVEVSIFVENIYQSKIPEHLSSAVGLISAYGLFNGDLKNIIKTKKQK